MLEVTLAMETASDFLDSDTLTAGGGRASVSSDRRGLAVSLTATGIIIGAMCCFRETGGFSVFFLRSQYFLKHYVLQ